MNRDYRTLSREAEDGFSEKRSRFLCAARPVGSEAEAAAFLEERRRRYWDAAHHCYAYVLRDGQIRRCSDDGEPQGTAGLPMLEVLLREEVVDCVVVVTRYFGGTLLGTGGLARAYSQGARRALRAAGPAEMRLCARLRLDCDYAQYGRAAGWIPETGGILRDTAYTDRVAVEFLLPVERLNAAERELADWSAGTLALRLLGEEYVSCPAALSGGGNEPA